MIRDPVSQPAAACFSGSIVRPETAVTPGPAWRVNSATQLEFEFQLDLDPLLAFTAGLLPILRNATAILLLNRFSGCRAPIRLPRRFCDALRRRSGGFLR